jgi:hydrophobe/amphiphile efflux-1 (HAE1) family protein
MSISRPFILRPIATALLALGLVIFGALAFRLLPVAALPEVDFPTIVVNASLPGASPDTMASSVASPLERQFATIEGLASMSSASGLGSTSITLQFNLDRDIDAAAQDVQQSIQAASGRLPDDMPDPPTYRKTNPGDSPILVYALSSSVLPIHEVSKYADLLAQQLSTQEGVSQVSIAGEQKYAVRIRANPIELAARGLSVDEVASAIQATNLNRPKGTLQGRDQAYTLSANDQISTADQFREVIVAYRDGAAVRLGDVAVVEAGVENERVAAFLVNQKAVLLLVRRQAGANTVATVDAVKQRVPGLMAAVPPGVELALISDRSLSIRDSFHEVELALGLTIGLVVLVIFFFVRSIPATVIPAVTIPISLLVTFGVMHALGYSLNNLTLMGLTIAVGLVVDDAIVMLENIVRHVEEGEKPLDAALKGAGEIGFTIVSITASLVAVFIPLLFMGGLIGRLFREFAVTVTVALAASMIISLSLTPMMASRMLKPAGEESHGRLHGALERGFDVLLSGYRRSLAVVLDHQGLTLLLTLATAAVTLWLYVVAPKGFVPNEDTGAIFVSTEANPDISFTAMAGLQAEAASRIAADPDIVSVGSFIGATGGNPSVNTGRMYVTLKRRSERDADANAIIARLRPKLADLQGMRVVMQGVQNIRVGGRLTRAQYQYTLQSLDSAALDRAAPDVEERLRRVEGLQDVQSDRQSVSPQYLVEIDRAQASRLGVTPASIDQALYSAFGERQVSTIYTDFDQYRVVLGVSPDFQADETALAQLYVRSSDGGLVPLTAVANVRPGVGPLTLNHSGQFPSVTFSFNLAPGVSIGEAVQRIDAATSELRLPQTINGRFEGTAQEFRASLRTQPMLIAAALLVVFIVLGVLYESLVHPVTILSTIPSAGLGAIVGLLVCRMELSVVAVIGILMLIGIVKKNAIMMVDFALERQREDGRSARDAIYEASLLRFRPILMTSFAAILGGVPLALSSGYGQELRAPLGVAIVSGLLVSQILTLYTTPVVFLWMERLRGSRRAAAPRPLPAE